MKKTHPVLYEYCMNKLGLSKVIEFYLKNEKNSQQIEMFENSDN